MYRYLALKIVALLAVHFIDQAVDSLVPFTGVLALALVQIHDALHRSDNIVSQAIIRHRVVKSLKSALDVVRNNTRETLSVALSVLSESIVHPWNIY